MLLVPIVLLSSGHTLKPLIFVSFILRFLQRKERINDTNVDTDCYEYFAMRNCDWPISTGSILFFRLIFLNAVYIHIVIGENQCH